MCCISIEKIGIARNISPTLDYVSSFSNCSKIPSGKKLIATVNTLPERERGVGVAGEWLSRHESTVGRETGARKDGRTDGPFT